MSDCGPHRWHRGVRQISLACLRPWHSNLTSAFRCLSSASAGGCSGIPSVPCTRSHVLGPLVYRLGRAGSPSGSPQGAHGTVTRTSTSLLDLPALCAHPHSPTPAFQLVVVPATCQHCSLPMPLPASALPQPPSTARRPAWRLERSCRGETAGMPDQAEEGGDSEATCLIPSCACPSGPAVALICISRQRFVFLATPLPTKQCHMHDPTKVLQLEDGKVSSSSSSSDSTSDSSSSSTSSDEEPFMSTSPVHPCRRLQRIPPTMSAVCRILPCAHALKCLRMKSTWRPQLQPAHLQRSMSTVCRILLCAHIMSCLRMKNTHALASSQVSAVPGMGGGILVFGRVSPTHLRFVGESRRGEHAAAAQLKPGARARERCGGKKHTEVLQCCEVQSDRSRAHDRRF